MGRITWLQMSTAKATGRQGSQEGKCNLLTPTLKQLHPIQTDLHGLLLGDTTRFLALLISGELVGSLHLNQLAVRDAYTQGHCMQATRSDR